MHVNKHRELHMCEHTIMEKVKSLQDDLRELKRLCTQCELSSVRQQIEVLIANTEDQLKFQERVNSPPAVHASTSMGVYNKPINCYSWDHSGGFVRVRVTGLEGVSLLPSDNIKCEFSTNGFKLLIENIQNTNRVLSISKLLKPIEPTECNVNVKKDSVIVNLKPLNDTEKWAYLTETDKLSNERSKPKFDPVDEKKDPSQSLMDMMKKMYEEGDDDMKRTIAKAWTESREKSAMGEFNN